MKDTPLRLPGQSCDDKLHDLFLDNVVPWILAVVLVLVLAVFELMKWVFKSPPSPIIPGIIAVVVCGVAAWKIRKALPVMRNYKLGRDGERIVGEHLERLREQGYRVFHDIPGNGFNVDHVLVGPAGVFAVETKTFRKPAKGSQGIRYDGKTLTKDGELMSLRPIEQAHDSARDVFKIIERTTKKRFWVRPVVLFPGWCVHPLPQGMSKEIWLLNPKNISSFIEQENVRLTDSDIALIAESISAHIRAAAETM